MAIYLDHNASTPLHEDVLQAMLPLMQMMVGNPSSLHRFGRLQKDAIERAREQVAALVDAHPDQVIFTSSGTEANNLLIKGMAAAARPIPWSRPSLPAAQLGDACAVDLIEVDDQGRVTPHLLEQAIRPDTRLVSVMSANNETGVIQDIRALAEITHRHDAWFHTDASQAAGKIDVSFKPFIRHYLNVFKVNRAVVVQVTFRFYLIRTARGRIQPDIVEMHRPVTTRQRTVPLAKADNEHIDVGQVHVIGD